MLEISCFEVKKLKIYKWVMFTLKLALECHISILLEYRYWSLGLVLVVPGFSLYCDRRTRMSIADFLTFAYWNLERGYGRKICHHTRVWMTLIKYDIFHKAWHPIIKASLFFGRFSVIDLQIRYYNITHFRSTYIVSSVISPLFFAPDELIRHKKIRK